MIARRSHYEIAFERYLDLRGTPYVPVEDIRRRLRGSIGAKSFDYIVYPPGGPACLVDVKGRKTSHLADDGDCRQKTWVTRADASDLSEWQRIFGAGFVGMFAFGYWIADPRASDMLKTRGDVFDFGGRLYSFWLVAVDDYARHQKQLSKSWETVSIPRSVFQRISRRLESCWSAAPCGLRTVGRPAGSVCGPCGM